MGSPQLIGLDRERTLSSRPGGPTELTPDVEALLRRPPRVGIPTVMRQSATGLRAASVFCVTVTLLMGLGVLLPVLALGWDATAIETGSMSPAVTRGDVVLLREPTDRPVRAGGVIRFRLPGRSGSTVHRVERVNWRDRTYTTRGDANPAADSTAVPFSAVDGVGTALVPMFGYPIVWLRDGSIAPLLALGMGLLVVLVPGLAPAVDGVVPDEVVRPWRAHVGGGGGGGRARGPAPGPLFRSEWVAAASGDGP